MPLRSGNARCHYANCAHLELRHTTDWIERGIGHQIGGPLAAPMKRSKYCVRANLGAQMHIEFRSATTTVNMHAVSVRNIEPLSQPRVYLQQWLRLP